MTSSRIRLWPVWRSRMKESLCSISGCSTTVSVRSRMWPSRVSSRSSAAAPPHHGARLRQFRGACGSPGARRQPVETEGTEARARQCHNRMSHGLEKPPHFPLSPLHEDKLQTRFFFTEADLAHHPGPGETIFQFDASSERPERSRGNLSGDPRNVLPLHATARVRQGRTEISIVCGGEVPRKVSGQAAEHSGANRPSREAIVEWSRHRGGPLGAEERRPVCAGPAGRGAGVTTEPSSDTTSTPGITTDPMAVTGAPLTRTRLQDGVYDLARHSSATNGPHLMAAPAPRPV